MILHHFHYFSKHLTPEVKEVYWFAAINSLALALTYIFEPIYLYQLNYTIPQILSFYVIVYACYCVFVFPAAKLTSKIGYKHSIFISSVMLILYWIFLYQVKNFPALFFIAPIFFALQKSLFWPAYNADVALSSQHKQRGREVGVLLSVVEVCSIIGPLLGGLISYAFGFQALFATAAVLLITAVYPLFLTADIYTRHTFKFSNFWSIFKKHIRNFFGYWGYAEDLMLMSLWPLLMFITIPYVVGVGIVSTFASLSAAMLMLYIGKLSDKLKNVYLIKFTSLFYASTWIFRFLATTVPSILVFDILTKTGKGMVNVPMISLTYDLAGSKGPDQAVAYSVFFEFSLAFGKIITALLAIGIILATNNIYLVFAVAGFMTLLYGLLSKK